MTVELAAASESITSTSTPGGTLVTAGASGTKKRIRVLATQQGTTQRNLTVEHDRGSGHPSGDAIVKVVDAFPLPQGVQVEVCEVVIYGHASDPGKVTSYVNTGTVVIEVVVLEDA